MLAPSKTIAAITCLISLAACPFAFAEDEAKPAQRLVPLPKPVPGKTPKSIRPPAQETWPSTLWQPIRLSPGVTPGGPRHSGLPSDFPRCRRIGDVVYIEGIARTTIGPEPIFSLGVLPHECMRRAPWEEISFNVHGGYPMTTYEVNIRLTAINIGFRRAEMPSGPLNISLYGISYPVE